MWWCVRSKALKKSCRSRKKKGAEPMKRLLLHVVIQSQTKQKNHEKHHEKHHDKCITAGGCPCSAHSNRARVMHVCGKKHSLLKGFLVVGYVQAPVWRATVINRPTNKPMPRRRWRDVSKATSVKTPKKMRTQCHKCGLEQPLITPSSRAAVREEEKKRKGEERDKKIREGVFGWLREHCCQK